MKAKIILIGLLWLVPVACWWGANHADRSFASAVGTAFALLATVFVARQPMLRCGACGASTPYFAHYTRTMARLQGNRRRYFACHKCGNVIDRLTGMPVEGIPDSPVVSAPSRPEIGCGVAGFGGLLVFGSFVIAAVSLLGISQDVVQPDRAKEVLLWCGAAAATGVVLVLVGWGVFIR